MMMVVGEEGTSIEDFIIYLKSEFVDSVYLQQNAFDEVDAATSPERQDLIIKKICGILELELEFNTKEEARKFFYDLRQAFIDLNYIKMDTDEFSRQEEVITDLIKGAVEA